MRKFLFLLMAILLVGGLVYAASIPQSEDAKNGPFPWLIQVYNNSGSTMDAGDVAIWDIASSTGDDDNYITTTTTVNTGPVAGVVYPSSIAAGDIGTIAIYGTVGVDVGTTFTDIAAGTLLCTTAVAGNAQACLGGKEPYGFAYAVASPSSGSVQAVLK